MYHVRMFDGFENCAVSRSGIVDVINRLNGFANTHEHYRLVNKTNILNERHNYSVLLGAHWPSG